MASADSFSQLLQRIRKEHEGLEDDILSVVLRGEKLRMILDSGMQSANASGEDVAVTFPRSDRRAPTFQREISPFEPPTDTSNFTVLNGILTRKEEKKEEEEKEEEEEEKEDEFDAAVFDPDDDADLTVEVIDLDAGTQSIGASELPEAGSGDESRGICAGGHDSRAYRSAARNRRLASARTAMDGAFISRQGSSTSRNPVTPTRSVKTSMRPRMLEIWSEHQQHSSIHVSMREDSMHRNTTISGANPLKAKLRQAKTGDVRLEQESRWQWLVMRPSCNKRVLWDVVSTLVVLYDLFLIPFEAFQPEISIYTLIVDWITATFWVLDMGASCITGYYEEGVVEMRIRKVVRRYVRSWFSLDCLAVAADVVIIVLGTNIHAASVLRFSKTARFVRVLRFLRLARLKKLHKALTELLDKVQSEYFRILIQVTMLMISLVILNHYIACGWYAVGQANWADDPVTWIRYHTTNDGGIVYWYTTSLHWSLTQFTPASMEVHATNTGERIFSVLVLLFALVAFSSFLSSITASMTHLRQLQQESIQQESTLRKYFLHNEISAELGHCILKYFSARRSSKNRRRILELDMPMLKWLPEHLLMRIHEELYLPALVQHPFFDHYWHQCNSGIVELCHRALNLRHVSDGETVYFEGEMSDRMFFVTRGNMDYYRILHLEAKSHQEVQEGQWCTEQALWMHWVHCGRLLGTDNAEVIEVKAESTHKVLLAEYHSTAREFVTTYARFFCEYILAMDQDQLSDLCLSVFALEAIVHHRVSHASGVGSDYGSEGRASFSNFQASNFPGMIRNTISSRAPTDRGFSGEKSFGMPMGPLKTWMQWR